MKSDKPDPVEIFIGLVIGGSCLGGFLAVAIAVALILYGIYKLITLIP